MSTLDGGPHPPPAASPSRKLEGFSVGQVVFVVYTGGQVLRYSELKVEKVGRKWVTLENDKGYVERFGLHTDGKLYLDGGQYSSPGVVYRSRAEYEAYQKLRADWDRLREVLRESRKPEEFTQYQLSLALAALEPGRVLAFVTREDCERSPERVKAILAAVADLEFR